MISKNEFNFVSSSSQVQFQDDYTFDIVFQYYTFKSSIFFFGQNTIQNQQKCYIDSEKQAVGMISK